VWTVVVYSFRTKTNYNYFDYIKIGSRIIGNFESAQSRLKSFSVVVVLILTFKTLVPIYLFYSVIELIQSLGYFLTKYKEIFRVDNIASVVNTCS